MGRTFRQLRHEDRIAISTLLRAGFSKQGIAKQLGFHRSTIYRELARNHMRLGYLPFMAECKLKRRRKRSFKLNHNGYSLDWKVIDKA